MLKGLQLSFTDDIPPYEIINPPTASTPEPTERKRRQRRHSPKGKASGTIKERRGNTKRKTPSISYFYEWLDAGKKHTVYIPSRQVEQIRAMISDRCSIDEILATIVKSKETPARTFLSNPQNSTINQGNP